MEIHVERRYLRWMRIVGMDEAMRIEGEKETV